ncbi:MAG TPA: Hpt domain-containing protein, partial [Chloroflexota bacterium]|nr:Hpt domain-containing protein [Chloroflexota bacterium]
MPSVQIDDQFDLFGGFVAEIEGYLPVIAANVRRLQTEPGIEDLLEESHRFAHTIKSSAAMIGIPELRSIAAPMEALLGRAYAGDVMIDAAVVATIDGALLRIRSCLTLQQEGGDMRELVRQNEQAFSALRTVAPDQYHEPSEDARDRLQHAGSASAAPPLTAIAGADAAPLPTDCDDFRSGDVASPPPSEASEAALDAAGATFSPPDQSAPRSAEPNWTVDAPERPRLTVLTGGAPATTSASSQTGSYSIAAEWLAEILGGGPTAAVSAPPAAEAPPPEVPPTGEEDREQLRQEWDQRLRAER